MFEQKTIHVITEVDRIEPLPIAAPTELKTILFDFNGRIGRGTYIKHTALSFLFSLISFGILGAAGAQLGDSILIAIVALSAVLATLWAMLALLTKRNHDLNYSGLWLILMVIPFVGILHPIYLCFAPGTKEVNKYGAPPL